MAIKQRALMKLDMTKKHILRVMRTRSKTALNEVYRDLTESRDLYREGLPRSGYAAYGEIYDGLILAVQKVMEGEEENFQEEALALCQELLEYLEGETAKETRFKKEIFFLPYKMSMFDSLESVWKAADEDKEHCVAYVMPIPYADRNPDQTVAAWHCERDQFPKEVPTLDWQQVDLKAWHPDVIVYHSPYDNCNAVTSVDEQYYSRNLRYCADKLVYIPYFVLDEIEPGNEAAEESIAHFITAPGVLNADLIVVQSEKMRQVYIHVLARHTNQGEEYWQAHVSGAGSPKIEKVLTSKKEDFELPEKWRRLAEGKKVILYNTSLTAMLQHSDKVCDKLRYVFDIFRKREDVVLWWRPHPLMKATFHSMRPQFEEEYLGLEKQYIEEGWGIYDDSSDLHRAIAWSDAYYGDRSSVVNLYQKTWKPILFQSIYCRCDITIHPKLEYIDIDEQKIWFIGKFSTWQGLFCFHIDSNNLDFLGEVPAQHACVWEYMALKHIGDRIIIAPYFAQDGIIEFSITSRQFKKYPIKEIIRDDCIENDVMVTNLVHHKDSVFFTCSKKGIILEYRILDNEYVVHSRWMKSLPENFEHTDIVISRGCCSKRKEKMCFVLDGTNCYVEFDLNDYSAKCFVIPEKIGAWNYFWDRRDLYVIPWPTEKLLKWNCGTNDIKWLPVYSTSRYTSEFCGLMKWGNDIVAIPHRESCVYRVDKKNNNVRRDYDLTENIFASSIKDDGVIKVPFITYQDECGRCFSFDNESGSLDEYDGSCKTVERHMLSIKTLDCQSILDSMQDHNIELDEVNGFTLDNVIQFFDHDKNPVRKIFDSLSAGSRVYNMIYEEKTCNV